MRGGLVLLQKWQRQAFCTRTIGGQNFRTFSTRRIAFLEAKRPMPAMLLRLLLQHAGNIEADHTDSGIVVDGADRNRETPGD